MISSLFNLIFKIFLLILKAFGLLYHLASATNFSVLLIFSVFVFVLSRCFRLKQPALPEHLAHAIDGGSCDGGRHANHQHAYGRLCSNTNSNAMECCWTPIANRAACLDNVENSQSAIEKVSQLQINGILISGTRKSERTRDRIVKNRVEFGI